MALSPKIVDSLPGLLIIDVQEKLMPKIFEHEKLLSRLQILSKACTLLGIPIVVTEQYPQGLGKTVDGLASISFENTALLFEKTAFSCLGDPELGDRILDLEVDLWIIAGIESHVCVLQTVRDLIENDKEVIVVQDAISSRNLLDHNSALQEMQSWGARITTTETLLFELLQDAKHPCFKEISRLIK